jgi:beta-galactosidase/beta-glucuronidase
MKKPYTFFGVCDMIFRIALNGNQWTVRQADTGRAHPAVVPGVVQQDLLRAKVIPDPFYRDNEKLAQWVSEKEWVFERVFDAPDFARHTRVVLRCEGLDTLATIVLNGTVVARTENMHRWFEFDVKDILRKGKNELAVIFAPPSPYCAEKAAASPHAMKGWFAPGEERNRAWIRKAQCHFGWDWGPVIITAGIWRPISIVAFDDARIADWAKRELSVAYMLGLVYPDQYNRILPDNFITKGETAELLNILIEYMRTGLASDYADQIVNIAGN